MELNTYTDHYDPIHNKTVQTLTEDGLEYYLFFKKIKEPELTNNIELIIDPDKKATSEFSEQMRKKLKDVLSKNFIGRKHYIIHRDGHTVLLTVEQDEHGNKIFLLTDSYNAFGTKDDDHLPLLRIIRELYPEAEIYTQHDKTQNDYCNCRIFAVNSAIEYERFCRDHNCKINKIIESGDKTFFEQDSKIDAYRELNIQTIPTPIPIMKFIQSMEQLNYVSDNLESLGNEAHSDSLHLVKIGNKTVNATISYEAEKFENIAKRLSYITKMLPDFFSSLEKEYSRLDIVKTMLNIQIVNQIINDSITKSDNELDIIV